MAIRSGQMQWRWDQGRLSYFEFDQIRQQAIALLACNGKPLPRAGESDLLRYELSRVSNLPFAPSHYFVWRNYKRVFGCQLLATEIDSHLVCTNLCARLAADDIESDQYFLQIANNFYYPSPVFQGYDPSALKVFPLVATLKLLVSQYVFHGSPAISLEEVQGKLITSGLTGLEELKYYAGLKDSGRRIHGDQLRQLRELLIFLSQLSFLKWHEGKLFLDISSSTEAVAICSLLSPRLGASLSAPSAELIRLGDFGIVVDIPTFSGRLDSTLDVEFAEGSRKFVTHAKAERSSKLRDFYFDNVNNPQICDMCAMDTTARYPWVNHLIELHHLLPLASPVRVENKGTTLKDLVGLCPTCHRATHKFYTRWLKDQGLKDFATYEVAKSVYITAKSALQAH